MVIDIDRVFNGKTIGRAWLIRAAISISDDVAVQFRDDIGHVERPHGIEAAADFRRIRWRFLERRQSVENMVAVNFGDPPMVAYFRVSNGRLGGDLGHISLPIRIEYFLFTVCKEFCARLIEGGGDESIPPIYLRCLVRRY